MDKNSNIANHFADVETSREHKGYFEATEKVPEPRPRKPQDPSRDWVFFVIMRGTRIKRKRRCEML